MKLTGPLQWSLGHLPGARTVVRLASQLFVEATFPLPAHFEGRLHVRPAAERAALAYLNSQVADPETREKLTPRYGLGCKRPSFHNSYLKTFNRPNVVLETTPISHVTADAVHAVDGPAHQLDVLILATGFKVMDPDNMPTYTLRGVGGVDLTDWWEGRRLQAYEGISIPGFPNHFTIFGPYGYNGSSYFALIEAQTAHILCGYSATRRSSALTTWRSPPTPTTGSSPRCWRGAVIKSSGNLVVPTRTATTSTRTATCRYGPPQPWNQQSAADDSTSTITDSAGRWP